MGNISLKVQSQSMLTFGIAFLYLASSLKLPVDPHDEGLILSGAWLVSEGALPYRDFWTIYAPGQFLSVGGLFSIFAPSILVMRIFDILMRAGIAQILFSLAKRESSSLSAWLSWGVAVLWLERFGRFGYTIFPALALLLCALFFFINSRSLIAGIFAGLALYYRHDFAPYVLVAILFIDINRSVLKFFLSLIATTACLYGGLLLYVEPREIYAQIIDFPINYFSQYMRLPWPDLASLQLIDLVIFNSPIVILALSAITFGTRIWREKNLRLLFILSLVLLNQVRIRSDFPHMFPAFVCALPLMILNIIECFGKPRLKCIASISLSFCLLIIIVGIPIRAKLNEVLSGAPQRVLLISSKANEEFQYLKSMLGDCRSELLVAQPNNALLSRGDHSLYFITQKKPASKYYEQHPGNFNSEDIEQKIISALALKRIACVVLANPYGEGLNGTQTTSVVPENQSGDLKIGLQDSSLSESKYEYPMKIQADDKKDSLDNYLRAFYQPVWEGRYYSLLKLAY